MKKLFIVVLVLLVALWAYLLAWPVPIEPAAWTPPPAPKLEGPFAPNTLLASAERLGEGDGHAPEDIVLDPAGRIYSGFEDGRVVRWEPDGTGLHEICNTGGRPLGMRFDAQGQLIVADAVKGLLSIDPANGDITTLTTEHGGRPFKFTDDLDIAKDGTIYFSDASDKFGFREYQLDIIEHRPNGRLLSYNPMNKETSLLVDQLHFANGVALAEDDSFVLVCETGKYRVLRYWLKGDKAGRTEKLIDNLPGFPDNISRGSDGIFWVAVPGPRDATLEATLPYPWMRRALVRLPKFLLPSPTRHAFVIGVDAQGQVVRNFQDPGGRYAPITSAEEHGGMLYFGSILEPGFARTATPPAGDS